MHKTLCLALLLTASAAHALTAEESQTLRQAAITAGKQGDDTTAFAHWQTLAEAGDAEAQLTLGLLHYQGDGTAQDSAQAREWLGKAAAQTRDEETRQAAQKALQNLNKKAGKQP